MQITNRVFFFWFARNGPYERAGAVCTAVPGCMSISEEKLGGAADRERYSCTTKRRPA